MNVLKEFRGQYKCKVLDYNKTDETLFEVKYSPRLNEPAAEGTTKRIQSSGLNAFIVIYFSEFYVNYGDAIDLNCTGDAFPLAIANWSTPLSNGFQISGSPLKISSFKWMHQGDYICVLDNGVKFAAYRKITLFAAEKSPNLLKPNVTEVNVYEGDDIIMDCMCERCEFPANLWWFYGNNSTPLNSINGTTNLTHDQQLKRIEMKIVSINKSGIYKCQMECSHHNCMNEFSINVNIRKPHTIANMPQIEQFYGCTVDRNVNLIEYNHSGGTITSNMYSCISPLVDKSAIFSIILLGKHL